MQNKEVKYRVYLIWWVKVHWVKLKADMKSYKSLETAAIFYSSEPFLKQVIS